LMTPVNKMVAGKGLAITSGAHGPKLMRRVWVPAEQGQHHEKSDDVATATGQPCLTRYFSAFIQPAISLTAILAWFNSLPMVKKPWNWPEKCR